MGFLATILEQAAQSLSTVKFNQEWLPTLAIGLLICLVFAFNVRNVILDAVGR